MFVFFTLPVIYDYLYVKLFPLLCPAGDEPALVSEFLSFFKNFPPHCTSRLSQSEWAVDGNNWVVSCPDVCVGECLPACLPCGGFVPQQYRLPSAFLSFLLSTLKGGFRPIQVTLTSVSKKKKKVSADLHGMKRIDPSHPHTPF